jgi:hypothetical protein
VVVAMVHGITMLEVVVTEQPILAAAAAAVLLG